MKMIKQEHIILYRASEDGQLSYMDNHGILIRCKNCKYFVNLKEKAWYHSKGYCEKLSKGGIQYRTEKDYCSYAERRKDEGIR